MAADLCPVPLRLVKNDQGSSLRQPGVLFIHDTLRIVRFLVVRRYDILIEVCVVEDNEF